MMKIGKKTRPTQKLHLLGHIPLLFISIIVTSSSHAQTVNIQEMQELVQRWVSIEQQETALVIDWQRQQQVLRQRVDLLAEEKSQLTTIVTTNTTDNDEVTERRLALLELQNTMESDQVEMERTLQTALGAINNLHPQLPPPLVRSWQDRLDTLAIETENTESNSNTQLQALLEMLNQLQDFQQRINLNEDTITFPDGSEVLVKQIYLGLSHAWYVSADGQLAGYGQSRPDGWVWLTETEVEAPTVQQAIAMLERNVDVRLVELPLILQTPPQQTRSLPSNAGARP